MIRLNIPETKLDLKRSVVLGATSPRSCIILETLVPNQAYYAFGIEEVGKDFIRAKNAGRLSNTSKGVILETYRDKEAIVPQQVKRIVCDGEIPTFLSHSPFAPTTVWFNHHRTGYATSYMYNNRPASDIQ